MFVEGEARHGLSPLVLREQDIERKCLWDIQVPLLCSSTVRQPTEPQVASGHRERMGTFPQRPARWAADTANKQPTLPMCTRLCKVLKDGRTSPQVSLSRVSKKQLCHPLKKVSQDRRSKAASMRSLSLSLSAAHTVVKFLVFKVFFSIKYNKKSTTTMNNVGSVACACPEGA